MITVQPAQVGQGATCQVILDALSPGWFARPDVNKEYIEYTEANPTYVAYDGDKAVGFLSLAHHYPHAAEIHILGVLPAYHRQGIGRQLVIAAENDLRENNARFLQVKTLGAAHPHEGYKQTREFYLGVGFLPLEEFHDFWGKDTPALLLVKTID